ncbi:MAG: hypothetical protein IPH35_10885 [Rhodoferax sp.]|nr:hypothetical protein [Rhodoferax sp.]
MAAPTRLFSKAYSAWRHLLLAASGRLSTRISQIAAHMPALEVQHNALRTHIEQQGTWNAHTQQRLDQQGHGIPMPNSAWTSRKHGMHRLRKGFNQRFRSARNLERACHATFRTAPRSTRNVETAAEQRLDRLVSLQPSRRPDVIEQQQAHKNFAENNLFQLQLLQARVMNLQLRSAAHALKNTTPAAPPPPTAQPEIDRYRRNRRLLPGL